MNEDAIRQSEVEVVAWWLAEIAKAQLGVDPRRTRVVDPERYDTLLAEAANAIDALATQQVVQIVIPAGSLDIGRDEVSARTAVHARLTREKFGELELAAAYERRTNLLNNFIVDWMVGELLDEHGIDLGSDRMALQRLYEAAQKAQAGLLSSLSVRIELPFISATAEGPKHLELELTRARFEKLRLAASEAGGELGLWPPGKGP